MADPDLAALFEGLFPPTVRVAWRRLDPEVEPSFRYPEEDAEAGRAIAKRRVEFAAGRALFHELADDLRAGDPDLGPAAPLLPAEDRGPVWPAGLVGAISHTKGLCAVAVARAADHPRLGLDVEGTAPLRARLWPEVLTVSERARLEGLGQRGQLLSMLHFSGKEAVYKWLSRHEGRVVGFQEVELGFSLARGSFATTLLFDSDLPPAEGRWRVGREFLATAVW